MNKLKYFIATLGGFQFGYAIGVMSGAILFLTTQFGLTPSQEGLAMSAFLFGALPGTLIAAPLANHLGRKKSQQLIALLFFISILVVVTSSALPQLMIGRILQGLAAGGITVVGPIYIAEVSPAQNRGFLVGCYQLAVTLGIFIAFGVNWAFSFSGSWQWMFIVGMIPAILHFIGFFFLPESHPATQQKAHAPWKTLLEPAIRNSLVIVVLMNVFQQITGVNAILYFAPSIFQDLGFTSASAALLPTVLLGSINFVMTILATFLLDRWGRRPLLIAGIFGMTIGLVGLSLAFLSSGTLIQGIATFCILLFIASFAVSFGPIPQLMGSELFPRRVRSQGMSLAVLASWIFNLVVVYTFIDLTTKLSHAGVFGLYALFGVIALIFILKYIPETKGHVLD